ncbi:MAG: FAD-binding oxidoreductase [Pararhodobacter sp.]
MTGFPFSALRPAEHAGDLPDRADVVVIGGGIAGVNAAWHLAAQGQRVVLCEKGRIGAEQSGRNWGWIRVQGRDLAEIPLVLEARRHWQDWSDRLGAGLGYAVRGVTYMARDASAGAGFEAWLRSARDFGLDSRMLTQAQIDALFPGAEPGTWKAALHTASDARAEPFVAVPMMARAAVAEAGVTIREGCAVRALDIAGGRVRGVVTEAGRIACEAVVLTGGAWSSLFLRRHGVTIPQLAVLSSVMATAPIASVFEGAAADDDLALRRRADGGYTLAGGGTQIMHLGPDAFRHLRPFVPTLRQSWREIRLRPAAPRGFPDAWTTPRRWSEDARSPFEAMRILDPAPDVRTQERVLRAFARAFPRIGRPPIAARWAGMIDTMPDVVPVLDHVPALPGLVLGTGLSGHGFGIGPAVGRVLADLVTGRPVGHDLTRFRLGRFTDGSTLRPGPAL